jgi:hypothetical protein
MQIQPPALPPIGFSLGGGGFLAMAFGMGIVDGLAEAGLPVEGSPMIGTSGGAWAAAGSTLRLPLADMVEAAASGKSKGRTLPEITRSVFGDLRDARIRSTAIELRSGRIRVLRGDEVDVADVVGASASAPGLFPPYVLNGRRYVDGGLYSSTAAYLAPPAGLLVVAAPMAGSVLGPVGMVSARVVETEIRLWRLRTGGRVLCLKPDRRLASAVGGGLRCLLDPERAPRVYEAARELAVERADRVMGSPRLPAAA